MPLLACAAAEIGFGFARAKRPKVESVVVAGHDEYQTSGSISVREPIPNAWKTKRRVVDGEVEFEATYHFDSHGRRTTPVPRSADPVKASLFFGGSRVLGSGVDDHETLPAEFARHRPGTRAYNYGFHGYGPSQALDILRRRDLREEIPEEVELAIYFLTGADLTRVIGSMRVSAGRCRRCANFELEESGELVRAGDFSTGRPLRTIAYSLLDRSNVLKFLRIDLPMQMTDEHRQRTVAVIRAVRDELVRIFPNAEFAVVIGPGNEGIRAMKPLIESADLLAVDYYDLYDSGDLRMRISRSNTHPSARAYRLIAERLAADFDAGFGRGRQP